MEITPHDISIRELVEDYFDNEEGGVTGYGGKLDIRPAYQREFVYKDAQRDAVIRSVMNKFPLNVMYWAEQKDGDGWEVMDGQQRTISICQYVEGVFSIDGRSFHNLQDDEQKEILDYELRVYRCSGEDSEKLEWFKIINIAGLKLTDQEMRNAIYNGPWVSAAKVWFSRSGCPAYARGSKYISAELDRQGYLETAIKWISEGKIDEYMDAHAKDADADELWSYFDSVITWVETTFPVYRKKEMTGRPWGVLYNKYGTKKLDPDALEVQIKSLMSDEEVERKQGIYEYLLTGEEKHLSLRTFNDSQKRTAFEQQHGICPVCKDTFALEEMEADHRKPWSKGGKTVQNNCQMLCIKDNKLKSAH